MWSKSWVVVSDFSQLYNIIRHEEAIAVKHRSTLSLRRRAVEPMKFMQSVWFGISVVLPSWDHIRSVPLSLRTSSVWLGLCHFCFLFWREFPDNHRNKSVLFSLEEGRKGAYLSCFHYILMWMQTVTEAGGCTVCLRDNRKHCTVIFESKQMLF